MNTYVLIPFGNPVHAGRAEIFPPGIPFYHFIILWTVLVCTGFGKSLPRISAGFLGKGTENHGRTHFHGNIVWVGAGNQDFHRNRLSGNGQSRFLRELFGWHHGNDICTGTGINPNSLKILRDFFQREFCRGLPWFWWCNNGDILVCHTRCESSSPRRWNELLGHCFTILDIMFGLIGAYDRGEADFSFSC